MKVKSFHIYDHEELNRDVDFYYRIRLIRTVEEIIADNYYNEIREMHTPVHLCTGQEAVAVGSCYELKKEDMVFSNHRGHGHYLAKGGDLYAMICELFCKENGCCHGKGGSMHLSDKSEGVAVASSIVAGNVPIGTGYALAMKQQRKNNIAMIFLGDGATEEGAVYESICFASIHKLPVVYVCENNLYAVSSKFDVREPLPHVSDKFSSYVETAVIDGNNVFDVYNRVNIAIDKARQMKGPSFIECMTYRLKDHHNITTGIEKGYRTQEEWDDWNSRSPLELAKNHLLGKSIATNSQLNDIDEFVEKTVKDAFDYAHRSSLASSSNLYNDLWG